jgi:hypothetical protein
MPMGRSAPDEAIFPNRYNAWTPRLAKAAYNFQTSIKDPGMYAHGGKYIIQLVYDSIENLNERLATPVNLAQARRNDVGHFDGSSEAFRHWDAEGMVPTACAKCHTGTGLPVFLANATNIAEHPTNGLMCESCHNDLTSFSRFEVRDVRFPSGRVVSLDNPDNNLCMQCHQGRESTVSVNNAISGLSPHAPAENLRFRNVHYFAAGATLFGNEAMGAYQYDNQQYVGRFAHVPNFDTCVECHDSHALIVNQAACTGCHQTDDLLSIRGGPGVENAVDYDGDGDVTEGIAGEIATMEEILYEALRSYSRDRLGATIVYDPHAYPYFFTDANDDGIRDPEETGYATWSPTLLKAAYNFQYSQKDPGGFAHNARYIMQVLYDSIRDIGGNVSGMRRP